MASIANDPNGRRRILFTTADGERKAVRLGKVPNRQAEAVRVKIEDLVASTITGHAPADETSVWVAGLSDELHAKLAAVDLVDPRQVVTLGAWLDGYIDGRRGELKPKSVAKLEDTRAALLAHLDAEIPLRKITPQQASTWRGKIEKTLSIASAKVYSGNVKTIMAEAVRRKIIASNPFEHLKSGATASKYTRYITPDEIQRIIDACPSAEWRLLFGLARYAGLRIPSESHTLTLADIDFEHGRLTVRSPKTEHHEGHEQRLVPITPKLMTLLQARFDELGEGESRLVTIRGGYAQKRVKRIIAAAGVEPWRNQWQTLRASCEKEWAMSFPQFAVSRWIGHSITVSGKHYANAVPDELFEKAAEKGVIRTPAEAAQNAAQSMHANGRNASRLDSDTPAASRETAFCCNVSYPGNEADGIRTRNLRRDRPAL